MFSSIGQTIWNCHASWQKELKGLGLWLSGRSLILHGALSLIPSSDNANKQIHHHCALSFNYSEASSTQRHCSGEGELQETTLAILVML